MPFPEDRNPQAVRPPHRASPPGYCEEVRALAPGLLAGYRSPFTGAAGADNPVVFAGFVLTNSETGCGAFTLTPRLVVQVCRNGMTITRDAVRAVHLGERLDEGVVAWSGNTRTRPWRWSAAVH